MNKNRLEAFSDGVIAIIITIMVLELKIPEGHEWNDLKPLVPKFLSYVFSFIYVGLYWNNHHHLWQLAKEVNGAILWANLHFLFWLSLFPFVTAWLGESRFATVPALLYGFVLFLTAAAWQISIFCILKENGKNSELAQVYKGRKKEYISVIIYLLGLFLTFFNVPAGLIFYALVAFIWIVPDKTFEKAVKNIGNNGN